MIQCLWLTPVELPSFLDPHGEIPCCLVGDRKDVAHIDGIGIRESGAEMKGLYPDTEGVLGASERTVGLDAELCATGPTPVG